MADSDFWGVLKRVGGVKKVLAPEQIVVRTQWLEVLVIPLVAIGLAWWGNPTNPTLEHAVFPWLWLAPLLVALRYGVLPSLLSSLLLLGNWVLADYLGRVTANFSPELFFGGSLLVMVSGEFSDVWRDRNLRTEEAYLYVNERLARITKRHLLLNLSHDRLEQEMLARPGSLRDALARLRALAIHDSQNSVPMPGATGLLQLLSQYVNIESAALYTLELRGVNHVLGPLVAQIGDPAPLEKDDELLNLAIEKSSLAHIISKEVSLDRRSSQLIVAPLIAGADTLMGVLAVTRLPFFSLNDENLQMMAVILAYYADNARTAPSVRKMQQQLPSMPTLFAEELLRVVDMQKKYKITSHIVVMQFGGKRCDEIPVEFLRIKRGLDLYWQLEVQTVPTIAVLMPFSSEAAKDGFLRRTEDWLISHFGGDFQALEVKLRVINLAKENPLAALAEVLRVPVPR